MPHHTAVTHVYVQGQLYLSEVIKATNKIQNLAMYTYSTNKYKLSKINKAIFKIQQMFQETEK